MQHQDRDRAGAADCHAAYDSPTDGPANFPEKSYSRFKQAYRGEARQLWRHSASRESPRFVEFISSYPRQTDIQAAWSVWGLIGFDDDEALFKQLILGLKKWKLSNEWARKEAGTIPTAAQFLNARQWETDPRLGRDAATKVAITTLSFNGAAESSKGAL